MNITKKDIDELNALLTIEIVKDDYSGKVSKILNDYRKNANIPGFRKGHVPMGMIRKQYGKAVLIEEINKIVQDAIQKYIEEEKLEVLGYPLPMNDQNIDWDQEDYTFEFELGLAPEFEIDLKAQEIVQYNIIADDNTVDNQIKTIRKQYGKLVSKNEVGEGDEITGTFTAPDFEDLEINRKTTFSTDRIKGETQLKKLLKAKVGDSVVLKTKDLFKNEHDNQTHLGVDHDQAHGLDIEVELKIEEVNTREMAEMNQEFFDKIFGEGTVTSEEEMRSKIKEDAEKQYEYHSDQKLLNDVVESLIENVKFDLPDAFLRRWLAQSGEKQLSETEAKEEYEKNEKGIRYQLIEGKLRSENKLHASFEELRDYAKKMIISQMAQFGQTNPSDEDVDPIVARILSNREEVERINDQLNTDKLLEFFKENVNLKPEEITFDDFVEKAYSA